MNSDAEKRFAPHTLSGKTVFVAASAKLLPELVDGLRALGADALPVAVLEAKEIEDKTALDGTIANLNQYDWIVFTSAWGVSFFANRLYKSAQNIVGLPKICAIGPATAAAAGKHGFHITLTADEFTAEGVMKSMEQYHGGVNNLHGLNVLIPRAIEAREFLPAALRSAGCRVDAVPCYQTVRPEPDAELFVRLRNEEPDLIVFTSAKAVRNYLKTASDIVGEAMARSRLHEAVVAAIGPVTASALESEGKIAEITPAGHDVPNLLAAIADYFKINGFIYEK